MTKKSKVSAAETAGTVASAAIATRKSDVPTGAPEKRPMPPVVAGMERIVFVTPYVVDDEKRGTSGETSFAKDEVADVSVASASHFKSRGVAKPVAG